MCEVAAWPQISIYDNDPQSAGLKSLCLYALQLGMYVQSKQFHNSGQTEVSRIKQHHFTRSPIPRTEVLLKGQQL